MRYLLTRVVRHLRKPGPHPALAEQILAFMPRHGMAFSPLRAEAPAEPTEPAALNIADPAAAAPGTSAYRAQLRDLVDRVWGRAMEDTSVPSTTMADEIIEQWEASLSTTSTVALTEDAIITEDESGAEVQAARTARVAPSASVSGREASPDPAVLSDVLAGMLQGIENDAEQLGAAIAHEPAFADALESARNRRPSHFHLQLIYPQEKVCQAVLNAAGIPPKARWLFQNYQFAKLHVQRIIEMREGASVASTRPARFSLPGCASSSPACPSPSTTQASTPSTCRPRCYPPTKRSSRSVKACGGFTRAGRTNTSRPCVSCWHRPPP